MLTWHWASLQAAGLSLEAESEAGKYRIILATESEPVPVRKLHSWTITVRDESGNPFIPRQLAFYGGMPGHGHGLPSEPQVTQQLEEGTYLVEGVLFNMFGAWELVVGVYGPAGPDKAIFPLTLRPKSVAGETPPAIGWDANALALMQSLRLPQDTRAPLDPTNRFDGRPEAIALGEDGEDLVAGDRAALQGDGLGHDRPPIGSGAGDPRPTTGKLPPSSVVVYWETEEFQ